MVETYRDKFNKKYGQPKGTSNSLRDIASLTGYKQSGLKTIFNKGIGAYKTNPQSVRPTVKSPEQWAYGRVYSAVMGGKAKAIDASHLKK
jgi:alkyl sulfatase BDS1-like metallo-beta-lactamase superfamily hydrolase